MAASRSWYSMTFEGCPPQIRIPAGPEAIAGVSSLMCVSRNSGVASRSTRWLPRSTCSGGQAIKKQWVM
eukprot:7308210-Alexandrium_andersonii.AAC.1